ncbi:MAG: transglutaminase [Mesorhizobium sp.]|uniref:transglutaminase-like cysteine peptidase n=2 Tax=Mesorhizobium TaxID=68287 RepID=UPI000F75A176|nr:MULTISPECIES: transglutaminase-like cysteine peptidase [unclassified Mesorhizobium]TGV94419.1 transglutaminase [Mesorhizobium sp. M00.F.Ca.ET.158.01.1.1]WIE92290.1 transglutaminase-like cysteine peptidase [Mesorhizobium sp. WSM4875]AZO60444.1 transglutaminase [Mesorhizobium sp. M1A.F.Ca.IN.022.06.1.1]MCT2576003.1 transglutaminase-like cysteine peptidase [Mesorhizobium sp. P13.3]MDF3165064.1 transglutaminase-like cysteine peptidase [Mesorhizobium sp. P16.1]
MTSSPMARMLRLCAVAGLAISAHWAVPAWAAGAMTTGGLTSQPIGHYDFCKTHPSECNIRPANLAPAKLTDALWRKLINVTARVNAAVKPMSDLDNYGKDEVWTYPDNGFGDCEDYVLEKRRQLYRMGISLADLLITVVRKPDGEGHSVLTVRTDKGDYILDNLTDKVQAWDETGYRYLKRQAIDNTGRWVSIRDGQQLLVGSVQ